jgi:hypothetical protein
MRPISLPDRDAGKFVPARGEMAHHDFAVDEIFGATEADETDFQGDSSIVDCRQQKRR